MNAVWKYVAGSSASLFCSLALAAEEMEKATMTSEPVSGFWIGVFFVAFIGLCVGIGVGIYRADKRSKAEGASQP